MSLRLEMLQVARRAPKLLGESADLVRAFLLGQVHPDGGFRDRAGNPDLYYTSFGLAGAAALLTDGPLPAEALSWVSTYLARFGQGEALDFVHQCCLARCWGGIWEQAPGAVSGSTIEGLLQRIERYRSQNGGYHLSSGSACGTAYGAFLAFGAYQDLDVPMPEAARVVESLKALETQDGAWTNERPPQLSCCPLPVPGATNATAAAIAVLRQLGAPVQAGAGEWLLARAHPQGGFLATPAAPMPDLLSTATALHTLAGLQMPLEHLRERSLDFIDSLWTNEGGFYGHWG
ncbi:MAG TPA: prenyltransferase/squalene oxidase repeat-containing protein, partial [Candidatus Sulfotelmatobacter sp.]|nr:prenyltransferase/squalene oxidase repeat-containing protein [Candidatus Sulfotelmatobacter sp.]